MRLRTLIGTGEDTDELHRHVIVSAIAALQTSHRGTIVRIVDAGDAFRERAAESIQDKFSLKDALTWVSGKSATFGELVAHAAPCNSVAELVSWLSRLLGVDMRVELSNAVGPYHRSERDTAPKLVANVDELLADLSEAFRLRHIFAHEAAPAVVVNAETCSRLHAAVLEWIKAVDAVLWATVFKDEPLTQFEMTQQSWIDVQAARTELAVGMRKALEMERRNGSAKWLRANHRDWHRVVSDWRAKTYRRLDGTMWPAVANADLAEAIRARAKQVSDWVQSQEAQ